MPSAYRLAMDKIEQVRAMLSGEVWHDAELSTLLELAMERLEELDPDIGRRRRPERANVVVLQQTDLQRVLKQRDGTQQKAQEVGQKDRPRRC